MIVYNLIYLSNLYIYINIILWFSIILGDELRVPINFEPMEIGEVVDILKVTCGDIEYQCELHGICTPPQPQGPFNILQSTTESGLVTTEITFRNCFNTSCQWSCTVDHAAFRIVTPAATTATSGQLSSVTFSVNAKTEAKVAIAFEPQLEHLQQAKSSNGGVLQNSSIPAKLFVSCQSKPNLPSWTYYLKMKVLSDQPLVPGAAAAKPGEKK